MSITYEAECPECGQVLTDEEWIDYVDYSTGEIRVHCFICNTRFQHILDEVPEPAYEFISNKDDGDDMFELRDDVEVLFEINGNKIVDYETEAFISSGKGFGLRVNWWGSKGMGSFTYKKDFVDAIEQKLDEPRERLDTECMGREFCAEFMKKIFENCEVEYDDSNGEST